MNITSYVPTIVRYAIVSLMAAMFTHGWLSPEHNTILGENLDNIVSARSSNRPLCPGEAPLCQGNGSGQGNRRADPGQSGCCDQDAWQCSGHYSSAPGQK